MMRLPIPAHDMAPDTPKFPTTDFAHEMARSIVEQRKPKKKKKRAAILFRKNECGTEVPTLNGIELEV